MIDIRLTGLSGLDLVPKLFQRGVDCPVIFITSQDEQSVWDQSMANTWNGAFPYHNTEEDGHCQTSPVMSFPANGYGLYDLGGNVWNWCADWYRPDTYQARSQDEPCCNPQGPERSVSPVNRFQTERVTKGDSFLCHPDYCASYRPSARRGLPPDTGMSHVGFRCVLLDDVRPEKKNDREIS